MRNLALSLYKDALKEKNISQTIKIENVICNTMNEEKIDKESIENIISNTFKDYIEKKIKKDESFVPLFKGSKENKVDNYYIGERILRSLRNFIIHYNCKIFDLEDTDFNSDDISINILAKNKNTPVYTKLDVSEEIDYRIINCVLEVFEKMIEIDENNKFKVLLLEQLYAEGLTLKELRENYYHYGKMSLQQAKRRAINSFCIALKLCGY